MIKRCIFVTITFSCAKYPPQGCDSGDNIYFHSVSCFTRNFVNFSMPSDPVKREKWIHAIRTTDSATKNPWQPNTHDIVCPLHFLPHLLISQHGKVRLFKKNERKKILCPAYFAAQRRKRHTARSHFHLYCTNQNCTVRSLSLV